MKYLICSDIHGREDILRFVVSKEKPLDGVIIAGDLQLEAHEIENIIRKELPRFDLYMVCELAPANGPQQFTLRD